MRICFTRSRRLVAIVATAVLLSGASADADVSCVDQEAYFRPLAVAELPSPAWALVVDGQLAIGACLHQALVIHDLTDPTAPVLLASVDAPGEVRDLAVADGYAYVLVVAWGLLVYDLADPAAPLLVATMPLAGDLRALAAGDGLLCAALGATGLAIIDLSVPTAPAVAGILDTPGTASDVEVAGDVAFVADGPVGLHAVSVAAPAHPVILGSIDPGVGSKLAIDGDLVYVGMTYAGEHGLATVDVSDPAAPILLDLDAFSYDVKDVSVVGSLLFVENHSYGTRVYDLADPGDPVFLRTLAYRGLVRGFALPQHLITYIRMESPVMAVFALEDFQLLTTPVCSPSETILLRVAGREKVVAAAPNIGGPVLYDVSDPEAPLARATLPIAGLDAVVRFHDNLLLVGDDAGLRIWDVIDPATPVEVGALSTYPVRDLISKDDVVFATTEHVYWNGYEEIWEYRLHCLDLADPTSPVVLYESLVAGGGQLALHGDVLYNNAREWLQVYDVSDPASPVVLATFDYGIDGNTTIEIHEGRAYVSHYDIDGGSWSRFEIWDLVDPAHPHVLASTSIPCAANDIHIVGTSAYLACGDLGVLRVDLTDPLRPRLAGLTLAPDRASALTEADGHLWAAATGLQLVRWDCADALTASDEPVAPPISAARVQAYPNPFNPTTTIVYSLPRDGAVRLAVYDLAGREVAVLAEGRHLAGEHTVRWLGRDGAGRPVGSGTYLVRVAGDGFTAVRTVNLVR